MITTLNSKPITNGARVLGFVLAAALCFISPLSAQSLQEIRDARLRRLMELNAARSQNSFVTNSVLGMRWPEEMKPRVVAEVNKTIELRLSDGDLSADLLSSFIALNDPAPETFLKYLTAHWPAEDLRDKLAFLIVARHFGPRAKPLLPLVQNEMKSTHQVIVIQAAAAVYRIDPQDPGAADTLRGYLLGGQGVRVRAADAIGAVGLNDESTRRLLKSLLSNDDVCVRVAAAWALWQLTKDTERTLPVLVASLKQKHSSLAIGFVAPSNMGESHHAYVARALAEMRRQGAETLPHLIGVVERAANAPDLDSAEPWVGPTALALIADSGPVAAKDADHLASIVGRERTVFKLDSFWTPILMQEIQREPSLKRGVE